MKQLRTFTMLPINGVDLFAQHQPRFRLSRAVQVFHEQQSPFPHKVKPDPFAGKNIAMTCRPQRLVAALKTPHSILTVVGINGHVRTRSATTDVEIIGKLSVAVFRRVQSDRYTVSFGFVAEQVEHVVRILC